MKKIWMCFHGMLVLIMASPLYLSWILPVLFITELFVIGIWGMFACIDCVNYYQKHYVSIMFHECVQYRKLVRKKIRKKEDFPVCLQKFSDALICSRIFFISIFLFIWLRFILRLW